MSRRIHETVRVLLLRDASQPAAFVWKGRHYLVLRVAAVWKETGAWWDGDGERTFFRVVASVEPPGAGARSRQAGPRWKPGVYELCLNATDQQWTLVRMAD